jgi:hypothetical protein
MRCFAQQEQNRPMSLYWKIIVRELRELAWSLGRSTGHVNKRDNAILAWFVRARRG